MVTKSGTNRFHGEGLYTNRNPELTWANALNDPGTDNVQNQYAAGTGRPIRRDKLLFFAGVEKNQLQTPFFVRFTCPAGYYDPLCHLPLPWRPAHGRGGDGGVYLVAPRGKRRAAHGVDAQRCHGPDHRQSSVAGSPFTGITLQTTDTAGATATQAMSFTINPSRAPVNNALLNGSHAFLLTGFDPQGRPQASAGRFIADGAGNSVSGTLDSNGTGLAAA